MNRQCYYDAEWLKLRSMSRAEGTRTGSRVVVAGFPNDLFKHGRGPLVLLLLVPRASVMDFLHACFVYIDITVWKESRTCHANAKGTHHNAKDSLAHWYPWLPMPQMTP